MSPARAEASRSRHSLRLAGAARTFALVALLAPALWTRDTPALLALLAIGVVWLLGELVELRPTLPVWPTTVLEPLAVGAVCGLALHSSTAVLGALAVGPLTGALRHGAAGAVQAIGSGFGALLVVVVVTAPTLDDTEGLAIMTWSVVALGLGMIATYLHAALRRVADPLEPYREAQALIRQLIDLSDDFGSGLDPATLGAGLLDLVRDELPASVLAVHVARGDELTPLVTWSIEASTDPADPADQADQSEEPDGPDELAERCWRSTQALAEQQAFAFPLVAAGTAVGVVAGRLSERLEAGSIGVEGRIRALSEQLAPAVVRLDTALLFESLRDRAATKERRRLAREMHDGLAQDIASLGYLADALAASAETPGQAERIEALRARITAIVAEVRESVVTLRTGVGDSASLGAALGALARRLTESSGVPIHVTLDERESRLRPEVEAELFRIAQQAMTNAVQHAGATVIDVHCRVRPPRAVLTVRDDGGGLGPGRPDSQGLEIMRERALLIGARLDLDQRHPHGTSVTVRVPAPAAIPAAAAARDEVVSA